jgi:TRAP-type C4-dicarboxylate transport system permease large subunit
MTPNGFYPVWTYLTYLSASLAITVWVARTLHRNGRIFLVDAFHGHEALADSVNHLLVVGFYLVNVGFVTLALKEEKLPIDLRTAIELLSSKIGLVLIVLGAMHFMNMYVFSRLRRRAMREMAPPPVPPQERIPVRA